jgi:dTDP-4-dehydrorhamnose 3,5-epimerase
MTRFTVEATALPGLMRVLRHPIGDHRGYLERLFCTHDWLDVMQGRAIAQINHTLTSRAGSVRGLHFQRPPHAEMKIVTCLRGAVFDVAVDLRVGSPTYLNWHAERLTAENHRWLVIPEGFAHGFQTLTEDCEMLYLHSVAHAPSSEDGLDATDPRLAIRWPLPIVERSPRDEGHRRLTAEFEGLQT